MSGGVYCPFSPRDPPHRLQGLFDQIQSRLVLIHSFTRTKFDDDVILLDIDSIITNDNNMESDVDQLSSVSVTSDSIAYVIFTSGSTGLPKAVSNKIKYYQ